MRQTIVRQLPANTNLFLGLRTLRENRLTLIFSETLTSLRLWVAHVRNVKKKNNNNNNNIDNNDNNNNNNNDDDDK